jgi:hypothetical protein
MHLILENAQFFQGFLAGSPAAFNHSPLILAFVDGQQGPGFRR